MYCGKCGRENSEKYKFCEYCGAPLKDAKEAPTEDNRMAGKEKTHSHRGIVRFFLILVIIVAVAGGGFAIWYYAPDIAGYFGRDNGYDENEAEEESNEEDEQYDPVATEVPEDSSKEENSEKTDEEAKDEMTSIEADTTDEESETDMPESEDTVKDRLQGEEIESEVKRIREIYNNTVAICSTDNQIEVEGIVGNYDANGNIIRITIPKSDTSDYAMWLYYENERLIFAYLEGNDAYRMYFYNEQIFRIRYTPDSNNPDDSYDIENEELETGINSINEDNLVNASRDLIAAFHQ